MKGFEVVVKVLCDCIEHKITPSVISSASEITPSMVEDVPALGNYMNHLLLRLKNKVNTDCTECRKRRVSYLASLGTGDK